MADLEKWLIFSNLDEAFVSTLRMVCVFGSSGNEALMVTQDDDVYAVGSNSNGCLGLGDTHGTLEPRRGSPRLLTFNFSSSDLIECCISAFITMKAVSTLWVQLGSFSSLPHPLVPLTLPIPSE